MNQTYTVKQGDTLYGISNQFGVNVNDLANLNNVNAQNLQIGEVLLIPIRAGTNPNNMFMYTVKQGDSLYKIAKIYNTTVDNIIRINNLKSTNLSIGQTLRIPEMYTPEDEIFLPEYINYTVKRGDTLYSIAREYDVSIDTLLKDNGLSGPNLRLGMILRIRITPGLEEVVEECFGEEYTPPEAGNTITYVVKKGDNLYSIARNYNTSTTAIMNLNNLSNNNLSIGQVLKIPSVGNTNITYTVQRGDSLYAIARKYNTSVDSIKNKNNLKTNVLSIGQKLII